MEIFLCCLRSVWGQTLSSMDGVVSGIGVLASLLPKTRKGYMRARQFTEIGREGLRKHARLHYHTRIQQLHDRWCSRNETWRSAMAFSIWLCSVAGSRFSVAAARNNLKQACLGYYPMAQSISAPLRHVSATENALPPWAANRKPRSSFHKHEPTSCSS